MRFLEKNLAKILRSGVSPIRHRTGKFGKKKKSGKVVVPSASKI